MLACQVPLSPAAAQPPAASSIPFTADFLLGRWTDNGNCREWVDFNRDGRFVTFSGAAGQWSVAGDRLTFQGQSTITARVSIVGRDEIRLTHNDGSVGASTRCPAPRRLTMPALPRDEAAALSMSQPITASYLIGQWTDDGDCGSVIRFQPDGRFIVATGEGRWTLDGEQLTFSSSTSQTVRVRGVGSNRVLLIRPNGAIAQSLRC
jgi:hypothetical protein